jgi:periplasmic divalent cation tolerance protein
MDQHINPHPVAIVLTTLGPDANANAIARTLVAEHLAACVNVMPMMTSVFRWQGTIEQGHEQQLVIKTAAGALHALEVRLNELHPYDLPEFLVIPAGGSDAYLDWVRGSVETPKS